MSALAQAVETGLIGTADPLIENLQVTPFMEFNPTAPCIDVYPADPFTSTSAYSGVREENYTVRARVGTPDNIAGQQLLLSMMDAASTVSVAKAIRADRTLGGKVGQAVVGDVSGFSQFPISQDSQLLGATWAVTVRQ